MLSLHSIGLLGLVLLVYVLFLTVYRLAFHPLAKFPGSKLAAITGLYEAYFDVIKGGKYIFKIDELHKQYGRRQPGSLRTLSL